MKGLSVHANYAEEVATILDEQKLTLNGRLAAAVKDRFDRAVFPLKDDTDLLLTKMLISDVDGADPVIIEDFTVYTTIKAAERKKGAYSARGATMARRRYDDIFGKVIQKPMRRAAHKGWITKGEWAERERLGQWSHEWVIEYVFDGKVYKMDGKAVHEDKVVREVLKAAKMLAKSHRGSRIKMAGWKKLTNKRLKDVTTRAEKAFARVAA